MTVMIFTFVLLLVSGLRELFPLMGQMPFWVVLKALALLIPFLWSFALPMGMLTATLMVFGRFSADQELTAARAGGVSLLSLISPILLLSLVLCGVSLAVNMEIAPKCRVAYNRLRDQSRTAIFSSLELPAGQYIKTLPGFIIFVEKSHKGDLQNVLIWQFKNETNLEASIRAPRGRIDVDTTNQMAVLRLYDATTVSVADNWTASGGEVMYPFDFSKTNRLRKTTLDNMTFRQVRKELRDLESAANISFPTNKLSAAEFAARKQKFQQQFKELGEPVRVRLHRQVAFSFACFGFTLVGIPLGIRVHRRETNIGMAMALGLVALYYMLIIVGEALNTRPELAPHLLMWVPNFLFQAVGAVLLWRANRGA